MTFKEINSYKTISEVIKILNKNVSGSTGSKPHTVRFWETQFKQIKPIKINNRRYYDQKNIDILLKIQFLLKDQGMTINGVKKILNANDCILETPDRVQDIKEITNSVDILFTQFSYANWVEGGSSDGTSRALLAKEKLLRIKMQSRHLQVTISK